MRLGWFSLYLLNGILSSSEVVIGTERKAETRARQQGGNSWFAAEGGGGSETGGG